MHRRILFVAPRFHTNQVGVVRALQAQGHSVTFHVSKVGPTEDHSLLGPVVFENGLASRLLQRVFGPGGTSNLYAFPAAFRYFRTMRRLAPDLVVIRNPARPFSIIAAVAGRLLGARICFYSQYILGERRSRRAAIARWMLMRAVDAAWFTPLGGEGGQSRQGEYYVPFPVEALSHERRRRRRLLMLMVAKYQPRKRHALLLRALSRLPPGIRPRLLMVGELSSQQQREVYKELVQLAREVCRPGDVRFLENLPYPRTRRLFGQCDLFVLPSVNENAAVSVLEAIAAGTPAICSDTCGTRTYIAPGDTGFVFRSDSEADLIETLTAALGDRVRLAEISGRCERFARSEFSDVAYYERFRAMIEHQWPGERGRW